MVSRENRVLLAALALVAVLAAAVGVSDVAAGSIVVALVVVVGAGILLPQLYLARVDDSVSPAARIRVGVFLTALFALLWSGTAPPSERPLLGGIAAVSLLALGVYEFVAGYRESAPG